MIELLSDSPACTYGYGALLGSMLMPGDNIALVGNLGAGKTQFVKGLAEGLGIPADDPVCSPSYTILNIHNGRIPLYHFDLYRLQGLDQIYELGFDEYFSGDGASIVEWADRMGSQNSIDNLRIVFHMLHQDSRRICFIPSGQRPLELLTIFYDALQYKIV